MSQDFRAGMMAGALLTAILLAGFVALSSAQTYLVFSGIAQHLDGNDHCNAHFTPGIGIEGKGYAVGWYDNSNCKFSAYAAKFWTPLHLQVSDWRVNLGSLTGLVTGYERPLLPVGGLVASIDGQKYGANLILIPPALGSSGVLWLQWKVAF